MTRPWQGCPMYNPLCPTDLCDLEPGHRGGHRLGTMCDHERTNSRWPMLPAGATYDELVDAAIGWDWSA